jgi:acyl-CoA hydrolase/RimJ/RimL family protein N-acetyltransferase
MKTPSRWQERFRLRTVDARNALSCVRRGTRVFVGSGCAEPQMLVNALAQRENLSDVEVLHIMTIGQAPYARATQSGRFRHNAFFIGSNVRDAVAAGQADYTPVFLSEIPRLFRSRKLPLDVALICTTPPDAHGFCSLGVSVDVVKSAVEAAEVVIAEINPSMPRTHGAGFLHVDDIDFFVLGTDPLLELPPPAIDDASAKIGALCAELIPHGATLQLGIGGIPNAVLASLKGKTDLGLHSEMISDGVLDLIESGAITCRKKTVYPGKAVTSFCMGTRRLYDFVDDNPFFEFLPTEYVNDPFVIARNDRMISVNSALQVDLTGQVCADSIGTRFYSGIGGQVDFIRGAARSKEGRSILALASTAKEGTLSRIVPVLAEGAGVVTTRGDVDTVVTEYGIAELKGRTVRERSLALISVAHPAFRQELLAAAKQRHFVSIDQIPWPQGGKPYPVELESTVPFKGQEIHFRPIKPSDERLLRDFFYSHSAETILARYHAALQSLSPQQVQKFCTLDYDREMALVGLVRTGEADQIIAVGRYSVDPSTNLAEVAFTIHDKFQGQGVGTWILRRLIEVARLRGIRGFVGYVSPANIRMMNLFHRSGCSVETTLNGELYTVTLRFPEPEAPPRPMA